MANGSVQLADPADFDIEEISTADAEEDEDTDDHEPAQEALDADLDAFMDGRPRPPHLDD